MYTDFKAFTKLKACTTDFLESERCDDNISMGPKDGANFKASTDLKVCTIFKGGANCKASTGVGLVVGVWVVAGVIYFADTAGVGVCGIVYSDIVFVAVDGVSIVGVDVVGFLGI